MDRVESYALAQAQVESRNVADLKESVRPTSDALGYLFRLMSTLPSLAAFADPLQEVGEHVGVAMVAFDAAQDWQSDRRSGLPNPIKSGSEATEAFQFSRDKVAAARVTCQTTFFRPS